MYRFAAVLVLASVAFAGEVERLQEDIAALRFLNSLELSREQVLRILPVAERGAFLRREFERERDFLYVRFYAALQRFKEEDVANEGLSDAVMRETGALDHALKTMGNRVAAALGPLEARAGDCLDQRQRAIAFPQADDRHPLDLLRMLKGSDFREVRDRLARQLAAARAKAGIIDRYDRREERLRLERLLHGIRLWSDEEYGARRDELLRELVPGRERAEIVAEIRRIYAMRYGRAGPFAEFLLQERMLPVLARRAGLDPVALPPVTGTGRTLPGDMDSIKHAVHELKADINLLNLMNGLHLEAGQLETIRKAADRCRKASLPEAKRDDKQYVRGLRDVRDALLRDETPPHSALLKIQHPLAKRGGGWFAARHRDLEEARAEGMDALLDVLTPSQGEVIRTYSPCLIPPKDLRDPVRAGQANDNGPLEALVDRLRRTELQGDGRAQAECVLEQIEAHEGVLPEKERSRAINLIVRTAREAQSMDDVAYAMRRAELGEALAPIRRLHTLKERLMQMEGADQVICGKIRTLLLDPRIIPLAQERIARLANPARRDRPDLPKAETCEDGKCGRP